MDDLDALDRHLLSLLQSNARESASNLARQLTVARTTVVSRLARLERDGVIAGYGVRLGKPVEDRSIRAYCGLSVHPKAGAQLVRALQRFPEIEELCAVSGRFDYFATVRCDSHEQLNALLDEIGALEGVNQTHTSIVLARKIDRRAAGA